MQRVIQPVGGSKNMSTSLPDQRACHLLEGQNSASKTNVKMFPKYVETRDSEKKLAFEILKQGKKSHFQKEYVLLVDTEGFLENLTDSTKNLLKLVN